MYTGSKLVRLKDQKAFTVTFLSHWSDVTAEDGEVDQIKWLGGDDYISHTNGVYRLEAK